MRFKGRERESSTKMVVKSCIIICPSEISVANTLMQMICTDPYENQLWRLV